MILDERHFNIIFRFALAEPPVLPPTPANGVDGKVHAIRKGPRCCFGPLFVLEACNIYRPQQPHLSVARQVCLLVGLVSP